MRKAVVELSPYFVLQDSSVVKLNQNESSYDIPAHLKNDILSRLAKESWNRYPSHSPKQLIDSIARYTGHTKDGIVVGNGSNEIILSIMQTFYSPADRLVVVSPGFSIYPRVAKILGLKIIEVPLFDDFEFDVKAVREAAHSAELVILASPNNPTGTVLSLEQIRDIARHTKGILVIDEAYSEFHKKTAQGLLKKHKNLLIIRTLSKAFRLAGARIGYLLAWPGIAKSIENVKLPFSVGIFQQVIGPLIMKNRSLQEKLVEMILQQRNYVYAELKKIPLIHPVPSQANFILFEIKKRPAHDVFDALYRLGVLIRPFDLPRLKNALRVTIGTPRENAIFLKALKQALQETQEGSKDKG